MGELVQFEDYVTEVSVTKQIRGGKLPARVYTIVIMEPDAVNLKELEQMKKQQNAPRPKEGDTVVASPTSKEGPVGVPKK